MENEDKAIYYEAYVVLNSNGTPHKGKHGDFLCYTDKSTALEMKEQSGGAKVARCRMYMDGEKEIAEVQD